jgi:hypothetical protein
MMNGTILGNDLIGWLFLKNKAERGFSALFCYASPEKG